VRPSPGGAEGGSLQCAGNLARLRASHAVARTRSSLPEEQLHGLDGVRARSTAGSPSPTVEELYAAHRLGLVRLATLLVDDQETAEEVVQDAFAGLQARWRRLDDPDKALAYLRAAVVNRGRSVLRRRRTVRAYVAPREVTFESAETAAVLSAGRRRVIDAVQRLSPRRREVLVLRYWSELSEAEIAAALGISPGTVKSTASRALVALEKLLEDPR